MKLFLITVVIHVHSVMWSQRNRDKNFKTKSC